MSTVGSSKDLLRLAPLGLYYSSTWATTFSKVVAAMVPIDSLISPRDWKCSGQEITSYLNSQPKKDTAFSYTKPSTIQHSTLLVEIVKEKDIQMSHLYGVNSYTQYMVNSYSSLLSRQDTPTILVSLPQARYLDHH